MPITEDLGRRREIEKSRKTGRNKKNGRASASCRRFRRKEKNGRASVSDSFVVILI